MNFTLTVLDRAEVLRWEPSTVPWSILREIWTSPQAQSEALSNTKDWAGTQWNPDDPLYDGEVYAIVADDQLAGLTGWFAYPEGCKSRIGLRWHGVLPQYRGTGLGAASLRSLAAKALSSRPEAEWLTERIPKGRDGLVAFFERLGFVPAPHDLVFPMAYCTGQTWEAPLALLAQGSNTARLSTQNSKVPNHD